MSWLKLTLLLKIDIYSTKKQNAHIRIRVSSVTSSNLSSMDIRNKYHTLPMLINKITQRFSSVHKEHYTVLLSTLLIRNWVYDCFEIWGITQICFIYSAKKNYPTQRKITCKSCVIYVKKMSFGKSTHELRLNIFFSSKPENQKNNPPKSSHRGGALESFFFFTLDL